MTLANTLADNILTTFACTDGNGVTAASHSAAAQDAVKQSGLFDGAGIFYDDGIALYGVAPTEASSPSITNT